MNKDYYVNVQELMDIHKLSTPKKRDWIMNYGEFLPIISIEAEV